MGDMLGRGVSLGTSADTAAAGNDSRITGAAQKSANLSDLTVAATARTNLGLGTAATQATSAFAQVANNLSDITPATARDNLAIFGSEVVHLDAFPLNAGTYSSPGQAIPLGQGGSVANVVADGFRWDSRNTGTSQGGQAGVYAVAAGNLMFDSQLPWTIWFQFRTDSALTNYCIYAGVTPAQQSLSTATPQVNSLFARFIQGTDTKFTAFGRAASGDPSAGATFGPDVAVSTSYLLRIRNVPADSKCYFGVQAGTSLFGNYGAEAEVTTLPAAGTSMGWQCQAGAFTAGTARAFLWRRTLIRVGA